MECAICAEVVGILITCPFAICGKTACVECIKRYLLDTIDDANCMFCRGMWDREMLAKSKLPKAWLLKEYDEHKRNVLFEQERANLPIAQESINSENARKNLISKCKDSITRTTELRENYRLEIRRGSTPAHKDAARNSFILAERRLRLLKIQLDQARTAYNINNISHLLDNNEAAQSRIDSLLNDGLDMQEVMQIMTESFPPEVESHASKSCIKLDCRGFLDPSFECGICLTKVCKHCWEEKDATHVCNKETVESVLAIKSSAKPCPTCTALIFRSSGCNTMFCVACRTGFNWDTLKPYKKGAVVANPEYYDYVARLNQANPNRRRRNRLPAEEDQPTCRDERTEFDTMIRVITALRLNGSAVKALSVIYAAVTNIEHLLHQYQAQAVNLDINKDYLLNKITEDQWKSKLIANDKHNERNAMFSSIIGSALAGANDLLRFSGETTLGDIRIMVESLHELQTILNDKIERVKEYYQSKAKVMINYGISEELLNAIKYWV